MKIDATVKIILGFIAVGLWANVFEGKSYVNKAYALICYPGTDYEECEAAKKSIEARESSIQMQKDISDIKHDIHALGSGLN